jgi:hypothetical protein
MTKQLFIEQYTNTGEKKVWKLSGDRDQYTFGSSRTADIVSIDKSVEFWEGAFEFRDGGWNYVSLNSTSHKNEPGPLFKVNSKTEIKFKGSTLTLSEVSKSIELNKFQLEPATSAKNTKRMQIFQVCFEDQVIETQIIPFNKKYFSKSITDAKNIDPVASSSWNVSKYGEFVLKQKTIEVEKPSNLFFLRMDDVIERESKIGIAGLALFSLVFALVFTLIPKTETYVPLAKKTSSRIIITQQPVEPMKKEKSQASAPEEKQKVTVPPVEMPKTAAGDSQPTKTKVAGLLKNLNTGRITSLMNKVSSQGQKSKTVIISDGVMAGSGPSGRALAAIGKIEKSGDDWSQDNGSKGFKISTNGIGGGKNVNSFATLSGGKVGKGGVGLIEDESEVVGGLDREEIANYIRTQLGQILYCYERQLSANKDLFGKVSVKFTISGSGKVETQTVSDTTLKNTTVEGCMLNKIASWRFPAPRGGTKVIVTYPFLFKSTN